MWLKNVRLPLTLLFVATFTLFTVIAHCVNYGYVVGSGTIEVYWNETGAYIVVQKMQNITFLKHVVTAFYNLSSYRYMNITLNLTAGNIVEVLNNGTVTTTYVGGSNATLKVDSNVCVKMNNTWFCGYGVGREYVLNPPPGVTPVSTMFNTCLVVTVNKVVEDAPQVNVYVQVYDYYTHALITSRVITDTGFFTVCGVPDKVLVNVTIGDTWVGMFYVATHFPTVVFPPTLAGYAVLIPLGVFIALAVRNRTGLAGIGAIVYGVLFPAIVSAFGLQQVYNGAQILLISSLSIMLGVVMLLFTSSPR